MYRTLLKALVVDALNQTFAEGWMTEDFRDTHVSIEFPLDRAHYPGIWVNYDDTDTVEIAAIDHKEVVVDAYGAHEVTRWIFAGEMSLTMVALSARERDALYDQMVRVFAFGRVEQAQPAFRDLVTENDFIAVNVNWDQLRPHGDAAAPGTPWGTEDEVIYEISLGFDVQGEFVSDWATNTLVPLSRIIVIGTDTDAPINPADDNPLVLGVPNAYYPAPTPVPTPPTQY
jgi:hypothetical protein